MQQIKFGNILSVTEGIIVQGCNAQGVMGSGVAAQIRALYPQVYADYYAHYLQSGLNTGDVVFSSLLDDKLVIANAITQEFFGKEKKKYVSYEGIYYAMSLIADLAFRTSTHVHYPLIGAGLGGGDWAIIQSIINSVFDSFPDVERTLWIYE